MNKLVTACVIILAIAAGAGAMFGVMHFLPMGGAAHAHDTAKTDRHAHPKPIFFADLSDIVVSIPPQAGAPATSYVQIGMQFSTYDQRALESFTTFQPIIKSQVINLLMSETSAALQNPTTRAAADPEQPGRRQRRAGQECGRQHRQAVRRGLYHQFRRAGLSLMRLIAGLAAIGSSDAT